MTTQTLIQKYVANTPVSSVTFSNINQSYKHLIIYISGSSNRADRGDNVRCQFNGDTGNNYSVLRQFSSGSSAGCLSESAVSSGLLLTISTTGSSSNPNGGGYSIIHNYSSSNFSKRADDYVSGGPTNVIEGYLQGNTTYWTNTAAITSIRFLPQVGSVWNVGTYFAIYGVLDFNTSSNFGPKSASGGIVSSDGTYWYHAFTSNGVFYPTANFVGDVLLVGGGGGGGGGGSATTHGRGGGGGSGGLTYLSSQSFTRQNSYNITVGSGGLAGTKTANGSGSETFFGGTGGVSSIAGLNVYGVALGGGGGGAGKNDSQFSDANNGKNGASGGGGATYYGGGFGGFGIPGQGNDGALGVEGAPNYGAGGGGGAGVAGTAGTVNVGGAGGNGVSTYSAWGSATGLGQNISGTWWFAGGGGGGSYGGTPGAGGNGGGGAGTNAANANAGLINSGGGGGGAGIDGYTGGAGGSGVVIIRYPMQQ